jgi:type II secretory pathway predicted ATPase ExeA
MVLRHFKLREQPFGVTPDPRYLYASATHREALSSLLYGIESGLGFVTLTASPGMGKTTLLFEVLRRLEDTTKTVFLFQTISTPADLVRALLIDLGVKEIKESLVEMQTQLNEVLVAQCSAGKRLVVAIDEAQNLNKSVLEAVRMLSNFETSRQKLMQIILAGQHQFAETLALPELLQLRQRISIFSQLKPLSVSETKAYVQHRLRISGYDSSNSLFTDSALGLIARHSEGIPRNINNICFNALSIGCALKRTEIDSDVIREVLADLKFEVDGAESRAVLSDAKKSSHVVTTTSITRRIQPGAKIGLIAAAACATVALFGWLAVQAYQAIAADAPKGNNVSAASSVQGSLSDSTKTSVPEVSSRSVADRQVGPDGGLLHVNQTKVIYVHEGQSLFRICEENFGECRPEILKTILKLNSSIADPDHIVTGQEISIPVLLPALQENK